MPKKDHELQRVSHTVKRRDVVVSRVERISASFIRLCFQGKSLCDFTSQSFDDHIKLFITDKDGNEAGRHYTVRAFDPAAEEVEIEFGLHSNGLFAQWAKQASIGTKATIGGPRSSVLYPIDVPWLLLAGDMTALPAIHRCLEELTANVRAFVLVHAENPADERPLPNCKRDDVAWCRNPEELTTALTDLSLPLERGFAWIAGEAILVTGLESVLKDLKHLAPEAMRITPYWQKVAVASQK